MSDEKTITEQLAEPFPPEKIKQREGNFGQMLDYIEGHTVIIRLNEVFGADKWSYEVPFHQIGKQEVLVMGRLTVENVRKEQFGSVKIKFAKSDGSIISIGDDLKAATTDALKKCATLFGVALHLYDKDSPQGGQSSGADTPPQTGKGNVSQAQLKKLAFDFRASAAKEYKKKIEYDAIIHFMNRSSVWLDMSKRDASNLIDAFEKHQTPMADMNDKRITLLLAEFINEDISDSGSDDEPPPLTDDEYPF